MRKYKLSKKIQSLVKCSLSFKQIVEIITKVYSKIKDSKTIINEKPQCTLAVNMTMSQMIIFSSVQVQKKIFVKIINE